MAAKNICFLSPYPPQAGGVSVHAASLAGVLSRKYRLFVITYGRAGRKSWENTRILEVPAPRVKFLRGLSFFIGSIVSLALLRRKYKIDIIHSQYMHPMGTAALVFRRLARRKPKVIITAHGSDILKLGRSMLTRRLISYTGNSCDRLIVVSNHLRQEAEKLGIRKDKIVVIENGVDVSEFPKKSRRHLREYLRLPEKSKVILFAGSLNDAKGADIFTVLAKHLLEKRSDLLFVLVGSGPDRKWLEKYSKNNGIADCVLFTGWKSHRETLEYIKASDVLVVPSRIEGFGLTALEGMCLGVPIAASRSGSLREILCPYSLTDNLPKTVLDILDNGGFRKKMIDDNKKRGGVFDWESAAEKTEKLYRAV